MTSEANPVCFGGKRRRNLAESRCIYIPKGNMCMCRFEVTPTLRRTACESWGHAVMGGEDKHLNQGSHGMMALITHEIVVIAERS